MIRSSLILLIANTLAGILNYFFQLRAASLLNVAPYGNLNSWMAFMSVGLSLGGVAQIASNFFQIPHAKLRRLSLGLIILVFLLLVALGLISQNQSPNLIIISSSTLILGILYHGLLGQLQGRTWFISMGVGLASAAVIKAALTFFPVDASRQESLFYLAFPFSFGVACLVQTLSIFFSKDDAVTPASTRGDLGSAAILAFSMALIPQLDLLNIRFTQSDEIVGLYSRASLFAKAIFFGAVTLLQISLPYHIRAQRGEIKPHERVQLKRVETAGLLACILGSFVLAYLSPWLSTQFLGFDLSDYQSWVLLSCLSVTALYGQLQMIQIQCALSQTRLALIRVGLLCSTMLACTLIQPESVKTYLICAFVFYLLLNLWNPALWRLLVQHRLKNPKQTE